MYEEDATRRKNEMERNSAALCIQKRWREYQQEVRIDHRISRILAQGTLQSDEKENISAIEEAESLRAERQEALFAAYTELLKERSVLLERNLALQCVLAPYFNEHQTWKGKEKDSSATTALGADQQYWSMMRQLHEERLRVQHAKAASNDALDRLKERYQCTIDDAFMQEENFRQFIQEVAQNASLVHCNRGILPAEVEAFLVTEEQQRTRIREARIRFLQLKRKKRRLQLESTQGIKGVVSDGMYLIDFEQLKIENANLKEKIEERNDDLAKLRRKVTTTVHVLTHMKEKLEFMREDNAQLRYQVAATEGELSGVRDNLAHTKKRRDEFLRSNLHMREKMPLVDSEELLLDYEQRKAHINESRRRLVNLTTKHAELMQNIASQTPVLEQLTRELSHYPKAMT